MTRTYGTYLKALDSAARGIAVDGVGRAVVVGSTWSIVPVAAYDPTANGNGDAFAVRLAASGATASYASHLGGNSLDMAFGVDLDPSGDFAYVTGFTKSANFPHLPIGTHKGLEDAFVAKLSLTGSTLVYSRLFGGTGVDVGRSIAVDTFGNAIAVGDTTSPTVSNGGTLMGPMDGMIMKVDTAMTTSFQRVGGLGSDGLAGVAVDGMNNVHVAGSTNGTILMPPLPSLTGTILSSTNHGGGDAFVIKLPPSLGSPIYGGYYGGVDHDYAGDVAVDWGGFAYLTGGTKSPGVSTNGSNYYSGPYDAFFVKIGPECTITGTSIVLNNNVDDVICGTAGDDYIVSTGLGHDIVIGGAGNDSIQVGDGGNVVDGGPGNDTIRLGNGNDMAFGGAGNDTIAGSEGADAIDGGTGADKLSGGWHRNVLRGGGGDDTLANSPDLQNVSEGGGPTGLDNCAGSSGAVYFC